MRNKWFSGLRSLVPGLFLLLATAYSLQPTVCFSAINPAVVWEVRTAGADVNGCGFSVGASGTDYSQQDAKNTAGNNISTTDAVADGSTTLISANAAFTSAIVGNVIYLQGGTGSLAATYREATVYTNATTITVDAAVAAGTGITMNIGGACGSPGWVSGKLVAGNDVFIKSGTYSITTASTNVSGGCVLSPAGVGWADYTRWIGYSTNRTIINTDTKPLLQASGDVSALTILKSNGTYMEFRNLSVDCDLKTNCRGIELYSNNVTGFRLKVANATSTGITFSGTNYGLTIKDAEVTGTTGGWGIAIGTYSTCLGCESHGNSVSGFLAYGGGVCINCLSYNNSGASSDGFEHSGDYVCVNCTSYSNGRAGYTFSLHSLLVNSVAEANGVTTSSGGFYATATLPGVNLINCAGYNNIGGDYNAAYITNVVGFQAVTAGSVFTNAAAGDFSLNSIAGRGALLRAAGYPGLYPAGTTTGYADIGAAQHADPAAGGGTKAFPWVQ